MTFKFAALSCVDRDTVPLLPSKLAALNPTLLAHLDDNTYHDGAAVTANYNTWGLQWNAPFDAGGPGQRDTQAEWEARTRQMFDTPGMDALYSIPEHRLLIGDHNMGSNNWDGQVGNAQGGQGTNTNITTQEEVNALADEAILHYQTVTDGTFIINPQDPVEDQVALFNNPAHVDSIVCEWNPWIMDTNIFWDEAPGGDPYQNNEYSTFPGTRPSPNVPTTPPPTLFWREGWKFDGTRDDLNPDIELFFVHCIVYRWTRRQAGQLGKMYGDAQKEWLKTFVATSGATYKVIMQDKAAWDDGRAGIGNSDGQQIAYEERDEVVLHFDTNNITGILWVGGDAHRPHVDNIPPGLDMSGESHSAITNLTHGSNSVCSSPFGTGYNGRNDILKVDRPWTMYVENDLLINYVDGDDTPKMFSYFEADETQLRVFIYTDKQSEPVFVADLKPNVNYLKEVNLMSTEFSLYAFVRASAANRQISSQGQATGQTVNYVDLLEDGNSILSFVAIRKIGASNIPAVTLNEADYPIDQPFPFESVTIEGIAPIAAPATIDGSLFVYVSGTGFDCSWEAATAVNVWDTAMGTVDNYVKATVVVPSIIDAVGGGGSGTVSPIDGPIDTPIS